MSESTAAEDDAFAARVRDHLQHREAAWLEVLHGGRSADDVAEQRRALGDDAEDVAVASALFSPMSADEDAALVDMLMSGRAASSPAPRSIARWVTPMLALAAAIVLVWWLIPGMSSPGSAARVVAYGAIESDGGLVAQRGTTDAPSPAVVTYGPRSRFEWVLRPRDEHATGMAARVFASSPTGAARRLAVEPEVDVAGAVRIRGAIDQLGLDAGPWSITVVVGSAVALPEVAPDAVAPEQGDGLVLRRLEIVIEP